MRLQPVLERQLERQTQLGPLRRMHMQIDETRQQILPFAQDEERTGRSELLKQGIEVGILPGMHAENIAVLTGHDECIAQ